MLQATAKVNVRSKTLQVPCKSLDQFGNHFKYVTVSIQRVEWKFVYLSEWWPVQWSPQYPNTCLAPSITTPNSTQPYRL